MIRQNNRNKKNERGIALMIALVVLLFMAIIGLGFMYMADTENSVNNNYRDSQKAYFASRAGLEDVRVLLQPGNPASPLTSPPGPLYAKAMSLDGQMPNGTAGVVYVFNPSSGETIDPTKTPYLDDELCQEQFAALNTQLGYTSVTPGVPCGAPSISSYYTDATGLLNKSSSSPASSDIPYTGTAGSVPFKWVRITNKQNQMGLLPSGQMTDGKSSVAAQQICFDGTNEFAIAASSTCQPGAQPVWLLTSMAVTPPLGSRPGSKRVTQMEVALAPSIFPPGVVSTEAPLNFHGNSVTVNATDNCSCDPTTCKTQSGITACSARSGFPACNENHFAAYTHGSVTTKGNPTAVTQYGSDLTSQSVSDQNVNPWPYNVGDLISLYKGSTGVVQPIPTPLCTGTANFTAVPPSYLSCPGQQGPAYGVYPSIDPSTGALTGVIPPTPQTTYIPGSVHLTANATGAGILIVDGDLTIDGGLNFYGLVLVRGQVIFQGGASSGTNIFGAILAGGDITNVVNTTDDFSTDSIGGNVTLQYDVCALSGAQKFGPPQILASHEIQY